MPNKSNLQDRAQEWIEGLPPGREFSNHEIYRCLVDNFPNECLARGDAMTEPRYKNDARWAVQKAKRDGIVADIRWGWHKRL